MKTARGRGDVVLLRSELETARLRLRSVCLEDAETVYTSIRESIEPLGRWMDWCHAGYSREDSDAWIAATRSAWEAGGAYEFLVFERSGRHVGAVGLNQFNRENNCANLGYWVRRSSQRQGFAVEAVRRIVRFAFEEARFQRVEIVAAVDNVASRRVAERAGATLECVARNRLLLHGVPIAAAVHSFVPGDLRELRSADAVA
jgi:RimJ/RimL family protein N-acetyltransferase